MAKQFDIIEELVTANRILANENIVNSFGHISVRHPEATRTAICCPAPGRRSASRPPTSWSSRSRAIRSIAKDRRTLS